MISHVHVGVTDFDRYSMTPDNKNFMPNFFVD